MNINKKTFHKSAVKVLTTGALAVLLSATIPSYDTETGSFGYSAAYAKSCFIAGTQILMADGSQKRIEQVRAGDLVVGRDGTINRVNELEKVRLAGRRLYSLNGNSHFVTAEHPFMTDDGWKAVNPAMTALETPELKVTALAVGDRLMKVAQYRAGGVAQGNLALDNDAQLLVSEELLVALDSVAADPALWVYNLLLDGSHSYFADGYLVHNKGGDDGGSGGDDSGGGSGGGGDSGGGRGGDDDSSGGHGGRGGDDDSRSGRGGHSADDDGDRSGQGRGRGRGGHSADDDDDHGGQGRGRGRGGHSADDDDDRGGQGRGRGRGRGDHSADDDDRSGPSGRGRGRGRDSSDDFNAAGQKLRGDGSVDDSHPGQTSISDDLNSAGQKLRGDGSVDDSQPGETSISDDLNAAGQKTRGDGSIDDGDRGASLSDAQEAAALQGGFNQ